MSRLFDVTVLTTARWLVIGYCREELCRGEVAHNMGARNAAGARRFPLSREGHNEPSGA
jgi:hypothetical protein